MRFTDTSHVKTGQDGAIFGNLMFRFDTMGNCLVYDVAEIDKRAELPIVAEFSLSKNDPVIPHANSVVFGADYYCDGDEFPLIYLNVYNNYAKCENKRVGECCVYRLMRKGESFEAELVQLIKIGFTDDKTLWRSAGDNEDVRPYGNFVIDTEKRLLYAFTMRDLDRKTRYFSFKLPDFSDGEIGADGIRCVTLEEADIIKYFDTEYHQYIQGACCHGGRIYSTEGFDENIPPVVRVIDPEREAEIESANLVELGYPTEAELIDFKGDECYYGDAHGLIFKVEFEVE